MLNIEHFKCSIRMKQWHLGHLNKETECSGVTLLIKSVDVQLYRCGLYFAYSTLPMYGTCYTVLSRKKPYQTQLANQEQFLEPSGYFCVNAKQHWNAKLNVNYNKNKILRQPRACCNILHIFVFFTTGDKVKCLHLFLSGLSPDSPAVGPRCQWRYDSCVSPCFKTCSDPSGTACVTIPK